MRMSALLNSILTLYFILRYLTDILLENKSLVSLEAILADNNKLHSLQKELGSALQYNLYITELNFISESGEPYKLNNDITHQFLNMADFNKFLLVFAAG